MQIDDKVELSAPHLTHELKYLSDRPQFISSKKCDAIDRHDVVDKPELSNKLRWNFACDDSDAGVRKSLPNRHYCRKAKQNIAELTEIDNANISEILNIVHFMRSDRDGQCLAQMPLPHAAI